jgi:hypothetical protein
MKVGIERGRGRWGLSDFFGARAMLRCGGGDLVRRPIAVGASMYRLWEWRGAGRRGNGGVGRCQMGKRRLALLSGDAAQRDTVVHGQLEGSSSWSGGGRGEVGLTWPIGPRLPGKKECWAKNGEKKNRKLDYEF